MPHGDIIVEGGRRPTGCGWSLTRFAQGATLGLQRASPLLLDVAVAESVAAAAAVLLVAAAVQAAVWPALGFGGGGGDHGPVAGRVRGGCGAVLPGRCWVRKSPGVACVRIPLWWRRLSGSLKGGCCLGERRPSAQCVRSSVGFILELAVLSQRLSRQLALL